MSRAAATTIQGWPWSGYFEEIPHPRVEVQLESGRYFIMPVEDARELLGLLSEAFASESEEARDGQ